MSRTTCRSNVERLITFRRTGVNAETINPRRYRIGKDQESIAEDFATRSAGLKSAVGHFARFGRCGSSVNVRCASDSAANEVRGTPSFNNLVGERKERSTSVPLRDGTN